MTELTLPPAHRLAHAAPSILRESHSTIAPRPRLQDAIAPDVVRPLVAERAGEYMAILSALLAGRSVGLTALTLDELRRRAFVEGAGEAAFLRDLLQLEAWGCIRRELEPSRIRGYGDARRDRFRHRLGEDATAFLTWLETRAHGRASAGSVDARERLRDATERVAELERLAATLSPERDVARRARHLVRTVDVELDAIEAGLELLDDQLQALAEQGFDGALLDQIVTGLEEFVREHVAPVAGGRAALAERATALRAAHFAELWSGWANEDPSEKVTAKEASPRRGDDILRAWLERLAPDGTIERRARRIEVSTRRAIAALRAHVHTATHREASVRASIERAIRHVARDESALVSSRLWGHRLPSWAPGAGERLTPPLPRRKARAHRPQPAPLEERPSNAPREVVPSRLVRRAAIAAWLDRSDVKSAPAKLLSGFERSALRSAEAPTMWMAIARARHLGRGAELAALGVRIEPKAGAVSLGDDVVGLVAGDCAVTMREGAS